MSSRLVFHHPMQLDDVLTTAIRCLVARHQDYKHVLFRRLKEQIASPGLYHWRRSKAGMTRPVWGNRMDNLCCVVLRKNSKTWATYQ